MSELYHVGVFICYYLLYRGGMEVQVVIGIIHIIFAIKGIKHEFVTNFLMRARQKESTHVQVLAAEIARTLIHIKVRQ